MGETVENTNEQIMPTNNQREKKIIIVVAYTATDEQMSPQHRKLATNRHSTQDELGAENINAISHKFPIPMDTEKRIKKKYHGHGTTHIYSKKKKEKQHQIKQTTIWANKKSAEQDWKKSVQSEQQQIARKK